MHFRRTASQENAASVMAAKSRKCRLVSFSRFDSAEPFDAIGGTLGFRGTPAEKH